MKKIYVDNSSSDETNETEFEFAYKDLYGNEESVRGNTAFPDTVSLVMLDGVSYSIFIEDIPKMIAAFTAAFNKLTGETID